MEKQKAAGGMAKSMGIRVKLIAVIIPIVLAIIAAFFALSRSVVIQTSEERLAAQSAEYAEKVCAWSGRILTELNLCKDTIESGCFANDEEILHYIELSDGRNDAYPNAVYIGDDKGIYLDGSGWVPGDDWVLVERDWYVEGKDHSELAFGEPYYDSMTGDMCVSATAKLNNTDRVRVMSADVYLNYLCDLMVKIAETDHTHAFLVTKGSQTVIAHPDQGMMAVVLGDSGDSLYVNAAKALAQGKTGVLTLKGSGGDYFVCMDEIPETDWILVTYVSRSSVLARLQRMELIMLLIAVVAAVVLIFASLRLMNGIVRPVARVTDVIQKVAEGDLSQNIEVKGNDEIARMGAHIQEFLVHMRGTMSGISETAHWLEQQSERNDHVSGSLMESSRNQSEAMAALNRMVEELSAEVGEVSREMSGLVDVIGEAGEQSRMASEMMKQTVDASGEGQAAAEQVSSSMKTIEDSITSLSGLITETENAVEQISNMVGMIVDVADETNLLSLNASIEAARAGEAGRGFAVVAEQIGKLAVSSGEAADDISRLTGEIRQTMERVVARMQDSVSEVKVSAELVGQTRTTFGTVYDKVGEADRIVHRMTELIGDVETVSERMRRIAENQVSSAGQIMDSAHELGEYTRSVNDDSDTVAQSAKELERESKNLLSRVSTFRME